MGKKKRNLQMKKQKRLGCLTLCTQLLAQRSRLSDYLMFVKINDPSYLELSPLLVTYLFLASFDNICGEVWKLLQVRIFIPHCLSYLINGEILNS